MVGKAELADRLAERFGSRAAASDAVDAVLGMLTWSLAAGERVTVTGFGTFDPVPRPERTARNPRTGASVVVPAGVVVRFRPGTGLKAAVGAPATAPASAAKPAKVASAKVAGTKAASARVTSAPAAARGADVAPSTAKAASSAKSKAPVSTKAKTAPSTKGKAASSTKGTAAPAKGKAKKKAKPGKK